MSAGEPSKETRIQRLELLLVVGLCAALLVLLGVMWLRQRGVFGTEAAVEFRPEMVPEKPIDLNTATWWELMQFKGIGEKRAKEIIEWRDLHKGFKSIDDLDNITSIPADVRQRMRERVRVEPLKPASSRSGGSR